MLNRSKGSRIAGFTLIELLVVVAVIAMLISILLPSLSRARDSARAAVCGAGLRDLGVGSGTYMSEFQGWFPGANTTGIVAKFAAGSAEALRKPWVPIQSYDWISPSLQYSTELGKTRAERLQTIINNYSCPSQKGNYKIDTLWGRDNAEDEEDFGHETDPDAIYKTFSPISYLMPIHFQAWGNAYLGSTVAIGTSAAGRPVKIVADCEPDWLSTQSPSHYQSRMEHIGAASRKVMAADGMRYLGADGIVDIDITPNGSWGGNQFGCFTSNGAWWAGAQAYGVRGGSSNWSGTQVNEHSESQGKNLSWSYRHGGGAQGSQVDSVGGNPGEINAMFFDGHVARLDDRASREIELWYPSGTKVIEPPGTNGGLIDYEEGYEVP